MSKKIWIIGGVTVGAGLLGLYLFNRNEMKKNTLAAKLTRAVSEHIEPATAGILSEHAFDIHLKAKVLEKVKGKIIVLKPDAALKYAQDIHGAWGWFNDDENVVYGVFRKLRDKVQVSQVANAYQTTYKENLIDVLYDKLAETEIKKVLAIVKPLPSYRLAK